MPEISYTETNAADDSAGMAFGLEGNLYLPILFGAGVAAGLFAVLTYGFHTHLVSAAVIAALPLLLVLAWALLLKNGKPTGYDRDLLEHLLGGGDFTRKPEDQGGLMS